MINSTSSTRSPLQPITEQATTRQTNKATRAAQSLLGKRPKPSSQETPKKRCYGYRIDELEKNGLSPLMNAVIKGELKLVENCVEQGANVNLSDKEGRTPLRIAIENGCEKIVRFLLDVRDIDVLTPKKSPLLAALNYQLKNPNSRMLQVLSDVVPIDTRLGSNGETLLHLSVKEKVITAVKTLVVHGANLESTDASNKTPLVAAAEQENTEILHYLVEQAIAKKGKAWLHIEITRFSTTIAERIKSCLPPVKTASLH